MSASNLTESVGASSPPADQDEAERSPLKGALEALPGELRQKLVKLAGTPEEEAEMIIGLFPYGHRTLLENYELISTSLSGSARKSESENDSESPRLQVHLTDLGREVIESCVASREEVDDLVRRARELHSRFSDHLEEDDDPISTGSSGEAAPVEETAT